VPAAAPVFSRIPLVRTLYTDLKNAGIQKTERFEGIDLHALRTSFVTNLGRAGVSLAQAQKLARHSTPVLTANVYTKLELVDAHAAVAKIDGAKPAQNPDELRAPDAVLPDGAPDTRLHQPALTTKKPKKNSKNNQAPEAAQNKASGAMHPAGFEPARWGSKPRTPGPSDKDLGELDAVQSGGPSRGSGPVRAPEDLERDARELLAIASRSDSGSARVLLAEAQELLEEAKVRREDQDDGKVLKLGG
jgi:hypothetical protein